MDDGADVGAGAHDVEMEAPLRGGHVVALGLVAAVLARERHGDDVLGLELLVGHAGGLISMVSPWRTLMLPEVP